MIFSSLSKREKIIFFSTCSVIGLSLFFTVALEPFIKKWADLNNQIAAKEVKLQMDIKLLNKYHAISKENKDRQTGFKSERSDEQETGAILSEIENLSRKSNVYVSVLKPYAIKDEGFYKKFIVEIDVETTIKDLTRFFYEIQNSPSLLKTENFEINAKTDQKDSVRVFILVSKILFKN
jgi:Tfp pilus assembly protein PilO